MNSEKQYEEIAGIAKALSHPVRLKILQILADKKSCICGEIVDELPLAQSTVSQHLKELKNAGLIKGSVDGPKICYCLNQERLTKAKRFINNLFSNFKCC